MIEPNILLKYVFFNYSRRKFELARLNMNFLKEGDVMVYADTGIDIVDDMGICKTS